MFDFEKFPRIDEGDLATMATLHKRIVKGYSSEVLREKLHLLLDVYSRHAVKYADCSLLTKLWNDLPVNGPHMQMLVWLDTFTTFKLMKDKSGVKRFLGRDDDGAKAYLYNLAGSAMPFYELERAKKAKEFTWTATGAVDSLLSKANKYVKDGKVESVEDKELIRLLNVRLPELKREALAYAASKRAEEQAPAPMQDVTPVAAPALH
jgi:hypothetical protein